MKRNFVIVIAFVAGLLLGLYLSHPRRVKAQGSGTVYVTEVGYGARGGSPSQVRGEVLGFSCAPTGGVTYCFVLSR